MENSATSISQVRKQRMKWLAQIYTETGFNPRQSDPWAFATNLLLSDEETMEIMPMKKEGS